jgi:hypothetical protein
MDQTTYLQSCSVSSGMNAFVDQVLSFGGAEGLPSRKPCSPLGKFASNVRLPTLCWLEEHPPSLSDSNLWWSAVAEVIAREGRDPMPKLF